MPTATFRWLAHLRPTAFPLHMRRHDRPLRDSVPYQFLDRCLRPLTAFVTLPRTRWCQWFVCAILPLIPPPNLRSRFARQPWVLRFPLSLLPFPRIPSPVRLCVPRLNSEMRSASSAIRFGLCPNRIVVRFGAVSFTAVGLWVSPVASFRVLTFSPLGFSSYQTRIPSGCLSPSPQPAPVLWGGVVRNHGRLARSLPAVHIVHHTLLLSASIGVGRRGKHHRFPR